MKLSEKSTLQDCAYAVCTQLEKSGITAVLTGGSAATFHAPKALQSYDLDFIITARGESSGGTAALKDIGYQIKGNYYVHENAHFPLEFLPGPLMIGDEIVSQWETKCRESDNSIVHLLTATDSCRDRLAAFLFWNDFSGLEQALEIAKCERVDFELIKDWCQSEQHPQKFEMFISRFNKLKSH